MYDLFYDLISETISIEKAVIEQNEMITNINKLRNFVLLEEESINKEKSKGAIKKAKTKIQRSTIISSQMSVIKNVTKLRDKRDHH